MRALELEQIGQMIVAEHPDPVANGEQATITVIATGICGSDIHGYTGENGRRFPGQIMGHESVGRISELPDGSSGFPAVGQLVTFNPLIACGHCAACEVGREQHCPNRKVIGVNPELMAAFAEKVLVPLSNIVPLSEDLPVSYGALIEPLAVALHAVRRGRVAEGDTVLVTGGGPIGQSVALAALFMGASRVIVSEIDEARRAVCERLGAETVNVGNGNVAADVRSLLGGPADVAIDAVGISATLADALQSTGLGARVVLVGMGAAAIQLAAFNISTEERELIGSFCYSHQDFRDAAAWVSSGTAPFSELITAEVPLEDAPLTFAELGSGRTLPAGKILIRFGKERHGHDG